MAGGMCGRGRGVCGRGCMAGGMQGRGACVPQQILRDTVNERAVRILLECILVKAIIETIKRTHGHASIKSIW